jgi:hypothetical protein
LSSQLFTWLIEFINNRNISLKAGRKNMEEFKSRRKKKTRKPRIKFRERSRKSSMSQLPLEAGAYLLIFMLQIPSESSSAKVRKFKDRKKISLQKKKARKVRRILIQNKLILIK